MTVSGEQGWCTGVAALLLAATGLSGCGGETVTSGPDDAGGGFSSPETGTADAATPSDSGGPRAEDTANGLLPLTPEVAAGLVHPSACPGWVGGGSANGSCDLFTLPDPPAGQASDLSWVKIVYDDGHGNFYEVLRNTSAACDRGWQLTSDNGVHFCSITCDLIRNNPEATVTLNLGCF